MIGARIGERVRIIAGIPAFQNQRGTVLKISEPVVAAKTVRVEALLEMPLHVVALDDGRHFRFRGRDLEPEQ